MNKKIRNILFFTLTVSILNGCSDIESKTKVDVSDTGAGTESTVATLTSKFDDDFKDTEILVKSIEDTTIDKVKLEEQALNDKKMEDGKELIYAELSSEILNDNYIETEISIEHKREINIFLSNFSEAYVINFDSEHYMDEDLISFAITHNLLNNYELFEENMEEKKVDFETMIMISEEDIAKTIYKYFDIAEYENQSIENRNLEYKNGFYILRLSSGEYVPYSQSQKIYKSSGDVYIVKADVYIEPPVSDPYLPFEAWEKVVPKYIDFGYSIIAKIKRSEDGKFKLVKYVRLDN